MHQIANAQANRHPTNILTAIFLGADLPSLFIRHFTSKVEKLRVNITLYQATLTSTRVTGTNTITFSSFEIM